MQDFQILPKEIVDSIFEYVPEYGHRVSKELHEQSLDTIEISVYCDFYRYCVRRFGDLLDICLDIYKNELLQQEIKDGTLRYLTKNLQEIVCKYIEDPISVPKELMLTLGIKTVHRIDELTLFDEEDRLIYKSFSYHKKVVRLYSLMILYDNGYMNKKEFDRRCKEFSDIVVLAEIILSTCAYHDHVYMSVVRHFPMHMKDAIERINRKAAIEEKIICSNSCYSWSTYYDDQMSGALSYPKFNGNIDRGTLINIRNHLLGNLSVIPDSDGEYDIIQTYYNEIFRAIMMIESLADVE